MGVEKFKCPVCGYSVYATRDNMVAPFTTKRIKILLCPHYEIYSGEIMQHLVAIKCDGEWRRPEEFLFNPTKKGLVPVTPESMDEVTLFLLWREARKEGFHEFKYPNPKWMKVKILWVNMRAVGYYSELEFKGIPILAQMYILQRYRRKGYGTLMVQDFLNSHRGPVGIESPNEATLQLLEKMGLIREVEEGEYESISRLVFYKGSGI